MDVISFKQYKLLCLFLSHMIGAIAAEDNSHSVTPQPFQVPMSQEYCSASEPNCTARNENLYGFVPQNDSQSEESMYF